MGHVSPGDSSVVHVAWALGWTWTQLGPAPSHGAPFLACLDCWDRYVSASDLPSEVPRVWGKVAAPSLALGVRWANPQTCHVATCHLLF